MTTAAEFVVTPLVTWRSPHTGARYPIAVRIEAPVAGLRLDVRALQADQELQLAVSYWEGAVALRGDEAHLGRVFKCRRAP